MLWAKKFLHTNSLSGDFPNWDLGITSISVGFYPSSPLYFILHNFYSSQSTKPNALTKRVQRGGGGELWFRFAHKSFKTKFYWHTKQRKQIKARWLTSLCLSYFNRDFLQQFSTEIPDSIFFSRLHIIKGELGGNAYTLGFKHQRTSIFFINVLFYRCFLHGFYTESGPELQKKIAWKGQNFKTKLFLCYKLPLLFSTAM